MIPGANDSNSDIEEKFGDNVIRRTRLLVMDGLYASYP